MVWCWGGDKKKKSGGLASDFFLRGYLALDQLSFRPTVLLKMG